MASGMFALCSWLKKVPEIQFSILKAKMMIQIPPLLLPLPR